ncbi:ATP-dependent nuclease [Saccharibacillus kuerlensis]|uniref:ATP-dependent endonuclease of the OLD family n=1 Tax=Saccharibacillus kuerlensis TaxID=459527 RepID=A0ABQ2L0F5_9BACL|nr:AAA family ATPase [Saccharibacillus kuerlensis]GGN98555.1 hypothetical protein GCM10010969_17790 [Saccharibacillus kuerlensis]
MEFKNVHIKNFRNFEDVEVTLANKNAFFGLNDVGKSNFLSAFRFVFDKDVRRQNFFDSDYHCRNTNLPIEITLTIDISDLTCTDNQKLRAQLKGALLSSHQQVFIRLVAQYDYAELTGVPLLYWGGDINNLQEMKQRGYLYEIDYVMNVVYIDSYVDLQNLFKKNVSKLMKNDEEEDKNVLQEIKGVIGDLNEKIASLSGIKDFEAKVTPEYKKYRNDNISVSVKSEVAIKGLYSNLIPYVKRDDDTNLYPTAGDGRKKLLSYSLFDLIASEMSEKKITLFLIEEPENHLHRSMQIALSRIIFSDERYKYLFVATHSPFILYEMNFVNLVRIYNKTKVDSVSAFYKIPDAYESYKKILNRNLSEAIFADRVLLVEGPSEIMFFEKVLSVVNPFYEADGAYLLAANGIGFEKYFDILKGLGIKCIIKTDNDLRSSKKGYSVLGFFRCNKYTKDAKYKLPIKPVTSNSITDKITLYNNNQKKLDEIRKDFSLFLSKSDLENDLDEVIHDKLVVWLKKSDPVSYLQAAKHTNMVELLQYLDEKTCKEIYEHYNFACLKEVIKN